MLHLTRCPDLGPICEVREEPPYQNDQTVLLSELRAAADYWFSESWGLQLQLPLKLVSSAITYRRLDGTPFFPEYAGLHHRDETLAGIADPWLSARFALDASGFRISGRAGLSLPLGRTEENPYRPVESPVEKDEEHQHMQFGTGTFNPVLGLDLSRRWGEHYAGAHLHAVIVAYRNGEGFQAGSRAGFGALFGTKLAGELRGSVGADLIHEGAETWDGVVHEDGNVSRTDVLAGAGLSYPLWDHTLSLNVRVPVFQRASGGQLSYPAVISLGVERTFRPAESDGS